MMRVGLYRPVHVKTLRSQKLRVLLTHRKLLQSKAIAIENDLRATLRNFGLKVGMIGTVKFEARIRELVESLPDLAVLVEPLLIVRRVVREQLGILHRRRGHASLSYMCQPTNARASGRSAFWQIGASSRSLASLIELIVGDPLFCQPVTRPSAERSQCLASSPRGRCTY